jgi:hypothetical protein
MVASSPCPVITPDSVASSNLSGGRLVEGNSTSAETISNSGAKGVALR